MSYGGFSSYFLSYFDGKSKRHWFEAPPEYNSQLEKPDFFVFALQCLCVTFM